MKPKARQSANTSIKALKRRFDAAHRKGLRALERGDYNEFGEAITTERAVIDEFTHQKPEAQKRKAAKKR
jgi:hypothetical protein